MLVRRGLTKVSSLLLVCNAFGVNINLIRQDHAQKQKLRLHAGRESDLRSDALFNMSWAATTRGLPTVEDKNCSFGTLEQGYICHLENAEHDLVRKWIPEGATVMELGARYGTTTCEIAKALKNSGKLVSIEPDEVVWGLLESNIKSHDCHAHVLRGAVADAPTELFGYGYGGRSESSTWLSWLGSKLGILHYRSVPTYTFDDVEKATGLRFDTLLIDCEGCAQDMMEQLKPKLEKQINLILIESDMGRNITETGNFTDCTTHCMDYKQFFDFLEQSGFEQVDMFNDCDRTRTQNLDTWCGPWIHHHAYRRKKSA